MTSKISVVTVALVASLTYVRPEKLTLSQVDAFDFPFYSRRSFNPGFPATTGLTFAKSDRIVQPKVLGVIDLLLLHRLTKRVNQLEEAIKNINENSQAGDPLASIKSDLAILKNTVDGTKNDVATIKRTLETLTVASDQIAAIAANLTRLNDTITVISKPTSIGGIPTSCNDLKELGNIKSGLYNIKSSGKVAAVYCDFTLESTQQGFQTLVGFLNLQTLSVHFYVQKTNDANGNVDKIPFDIENLNVGGAMDIKTGIFTAPVDGTYFFAFSGVIKSTANKKKEEDCNIVLTLNGEAAGETKFIGYFSDKTQTTSLLHLEATLKLKKDDEIWLKFVASPEVFLVGQSISSFTGSLLEEEISLLQ